MVIDTSVVLSILLQEPDADYFAQAVSEDPRLLMSSFSFLEASAVITERKGPTAGRELDLLIHRARIEIVSFNAEQAEVAREAWIRYGKGRHPAALNPGDCCAYALARISGEPLLYKGSDFSRTDVRQARS